MKVLKFGGSSATDSKNVKKIIEIIENHPYRDDGLIVVFSAFKGITDKLTLTGKTAAKGDSTVTMIKEISDLHFNMVRELLPVTRESEVITKVMTLIRELRETLQGVSLIRELSLRSLDTIMSFGERLSAMIIYEAIRAKNTDVELLDSRELIKCDSNFGAGRVDFNETNMRVKEYFSHNRAKLQITTGFIASTLNGETITLGRGGSDYSASILGAALEVKEIEIWKDVPGIMSADPKRVPAALPVLSLSYEEASEISHLGAKVLYHPTMFPATEKNIAIRIMNTLDPSFMGTVIGGDDNVANESIKGISSIDSISLLILKGIGTEAIPGFSKRFFSALRKKEVECFLFSHCSSEKQITAAIVPEVADEVVASLREEFRYEFMIGEIKSIKIKSDLSLVSVIGSGVRYNSSSTSKFFSALERAEVKIHAIAKGSSELNISAIISKRELTDALNSLHESFFNNDAKSVNLFVVGTGLIGGTLLSRLAQQTHYLNEKENVNINLRGICNSRKMVIGRTIIPAEGWSDHLEKFGERGNLEQFIEKIIEYKFDNALLVDCTAEDKVAPLYKRILNSGISVATPNKVANSSDYEYYKELHNAAVNKRAGFFYEANVGAGLPILRTIKELVLSGDVITKIEGVLSGSLSFIFNKYDGETPFVKVVNEALALGHTEPNPWEDLSGNDVVRKLIILLRESQLNIDTRDIVVERPLPDSLLGYHTKESLHDALSNNESWFAQIKRNADKENKRIRYIASYENGKASVKLKSVGPDHPFFYMQEGENCVAINSKYYNTIPLVVRGPGSGAEVTTSALFADIIRNAR